MIQIVLNRLLLGPLLVVALAGPPPTAVSDPAVAESSEGVRVHVAIRGAGASRQSVRAQVEFRPLDVRDTEWRSAELPLDQGVGELVLPLDSLRPWSVRAFAQDLWSPAVVVPPDGERRVDLTLWPAGGIAFMVGPAEEDSSIRALELKLSPAAPPGGSLQPPGTQELSCLVEDLRVQCAVPAGRWNVRVVAPGWAARDLWGVEVRAAKLAELGTLALRRGGSVFGRVVAKDGGVDSKNLSVELRPWIDPDPLVDHLGEEIRRLTLEAELNERGEFQLVGVSAGTYELIARHPGYSPASLAPFRASGEGWTTIEEPLILEPLLRLVVSVSPSVGPWGEHWDLQLHRSEGSQSLQRVAAGEADGAGLWSSPPLPAGRYELQIVDGQKNSLYWEEVELSDAASEIQVDLPLIYVEGQVLLDDEPLEARLWFGGRSGGERVETESDEEGSFLVVLPREGEWVVDISADAPPVQHRGFEVEVEPIADLRTASVVIELPDTRIFGEVVDETGLALSEPAELHVVPMSQADTRRRFLGSRTDSDGRFELVAIAPDVYSIEATSRQGSSESVLVNVTEEVDVSVRLTLRSGRQLVGRVVSEAGPVPHALVMAYPVAAPGQRPGFTSPTTRTGSDGRFQMKVPGTATSVRLTVLAPGYALASRTVNQGAAIEIALSREHGTLRITAGRETGSEADFVMVQGEPLDLSTLETWARMNGAPPDGGSLLVVPGMPPGGYAVCRLPFEEALLVLGGAALPTAEACNEGFLAPGGELALGSGSRGVGR